LKNQSNATPSAFDAAGISQAYTVLGKNQLTRKRQLLLPLAMPGKIGKFLNKTDATPSAFD